MIRIFEQGERLILNTKMLPVFSFTCHHGNQNKVEKSATFSNICILLMFIVSFLFNGINEDDNHLYLFSA